MSDFTITNARAVLRGRLECCNIAVADGKIRGVFPAGETYGKAYNAKGNYVLPGLIDIHTHGAKGVDFNDADADDIFRVRDFFLSQGVTTFFPTVRADSPERMLRAAEQIGRAGTVMGCGQIGGIHLEGPFLAMEFRGQMDAEALCPCSEKIIRRLNAVSHGLVRLITIAPEVPGAEELIRALSPEGFRFSLGHSGADYETASRCIDEGAVSATHTFNYMRPFRHYDPGITGAVLDSEMYCEAVCDGKFLHPAAVRILMREKGLKRVIAVTDSVLAAGMPDGTYQINGSQAELKNGDLLFSDSGLRAGSCLTALQGLKNVMQFTGLPIEGVSPMFSENPARMLGLSGKGSIEIGRDADLIILDSNLNLLATFCNGELLYSRS